MAEGEDRGLATQPKETLQKRSSDKLAAERARSLHNLQQIALAMLNYHDVHTRFPPAVVYSPQGKPLYSWRVLLLPFLEEDELYKQFKLEEAWDSPHNKKLLAKMPRVYAPVGGQTKESSATFYQVFAGAEAAFAGDSERPPRQLPGAVINPAWTGRRIADFTDGTSNTFLVVEAGEPVPWTKPADLPYASKRPLPKLGGLFSDGFHAAFADGKVYFIPATLEEKTLRGLITRNGGEDILRDKLLARLVEKGEEPSYLGKPASHWSEQIRDKNVGRRVEAVQALAEIAAIARNVKGAEPIFRAATQALVEALADADGWVCQAAAKALESLGPAAKAAVPALLDSLRGRDDFTWQRIAQVLEQIGPDAAPALVQALDDDDYEVRTTAAHVLWRSFSRNAEGGRRGHALPDQPPAAAAAPPEALEQRYKRLYAALDLDKTSPQGREGILTLLEALREKGEPERASQLRARAAMALARMGPLARVAIPDLLRMGPQDASLLSQQQLAEALGALAQGAQPTVPGLKDAVAVPASWHALQGRDTPAQLGRESIPALIAILKRPNGPRQEAARALGERGPAAKAAVPALLRMLGDMSPQDRAEAAKALGSIGPAAAEALPVLTRMLRDEQDWCRFEAAHALLRIDAGKREAVLPTLKDFLKPQTSALLKGQNPALEVEAAWVLANHEPANQEACRALLRLQNYSGLGLDREQARERLSQLNPAARKTLLAVGAPLLKAPDANTRRGAALALAHFAAEAALPVLLEMGKDGNREERSAAARALERLGARAKPVFRELCKLFETPKTRSSWDIDFGDDHLAWALAKIDAQAAVPVLLRVWRDRPPPTKPPAITPHSTLSPQGKGTGQGEGSKGAGKDPAQPAATGQLADPFQDMHRLWVQQSAFNVLLELGPKAKEAIPVLLSDLKEPSSGSGNSGWFPEVHEQAGMLLAKIGPGAVPGLVEVARDKDPERRARAAGVLSRIGPEARSAVPKLVELLKDENAVVRQEAVIALGNIDARDKTVAAALIQARQDDDVRVRRQAVRALGGVGVEAVPVLEAALADPDKDTCLGAAGALGRIGPAAVAALRTALGHKSAMVRRLAVLSLGDIGPETEGVVAALVQATKDKNRDVRRMAVSLLDRPGRELSKVVPTLAASLRDRDTQVRWTAAFVLQELGADAHDAVPALARALQDQDLEVRSRALYALRAMGSGARATLPAIKELLSEHEAGDVRTVVGNTLRAEAAEALLEIDPEPMKLFAEALKAPDLSVRDTARDALIRLGPKAIPALLTLAGDRDLGARLQAIRCLGEIADQPETVVPALVRLLQDDNADVRRAAASAAAGFGPDAKAAVPALRAILRHKGADRRSDAPPADSVPGLPAMLRQRDSAKYDAVVALGQIGPDARDAVPELIEALNGTDDQVSLAAAQALARLGPDAKGAAQALVKCLGRLPAGPAAQALLAMDPDEAARALTEGLKQKEIRARHGALELFAKLAARHKLDPSPLIEALKDKNPDVYWPVIGLLSDLGPAAIPPVLDAAHDKVPDTRWKAAAALGGMAAKAREAGTDLGPVVKDKIVPLLIELLKDKSEDVRSASAQSLGQIGPDARAAIEPLRKLAQNNSNGQTRTFAAEALKKIDPKAAAGPGGSAESRP